MNKIEKQVLLIMAMAQFILTLDSTVMNVSISTLVVDLHTTVSGVQLAITFYTLIMAAFMIAGAKIGDIIGRKKAFVIGLIIYGIGSFITAISPNLAILMFGWSFLEGIGAALIIPAMLSLIAGNYPEGPKRIKAYASVAAMAAIGAAVGPIIGGVLTTYATWRLAFLSEVLVVIYILIKRGIIRDAIAKVADTSFDWFGLVFSASGLALLVYGILQAATYGLVKARKDWVVGGKTLLLAGQISPTIILMSIGLLLLLAFAILEQYRIRARKTALLNLKLLRIKTVSSGVWTIFFQLLLLGGVMYGVALYVQIDLGYNAMKTGLTLLPLSVMILLLASRGSVMAGKWSARTLCRVGFVLMLGGSILLGLRSGNQASGLQLAPALVLLGAGMGIIAAQLQNSVQNSVSAKDSAEVSGLMATFQYLGQSFGTALSGVLIVSTMIVVSGNLISHSSLSVSQQQQLSTAYEQQAQVISDSQIKTATANQTPEVQQEVVSINAEVRNKSLSSMFILLAVISLLGLFATKNLPADTAKTATV